MPVVSKQLKRPTEKECRLPDGTIDRNKFTSLEIARGYRCCACFQAVLFGECVGPALCSVCASAKWRQGEWDSEHRVRCPKCCTISDPTPALPVGEDCKLGDFELCLQCGACSEVFTVQCKLQYSFTSPPLKIEDSDAGQEAESHSETEQTVAGEGESALTEIDTPATEPLPLLQT